MRWICEIEQSSDELLATVIDGDRVERIPLRDLGRLNLRTPPERARIDAVSRIYVEWTFDEIRPAPVDLLIRVRTLPARAFTSQAFFVATHYNRELVIPAQELIRVLFGRSNPCWSLLFTPRGPAAGKIAVATQARGHPNPGFASEARVRSSVLTEHLLWPQSYPSARAGWGSVYAKALEGGLGLVIPKARYAFTLNYCKSEIYSIAFGLILRSVSPMEDPFESLAGLEPPMFGGKAPNTSPSRVPSRDGSWHCSDMEWEEIARRIPSQLNRFQKIRKRALTDLILHKFGQGIMWEMLPSEPQEIVAAKGWSFILARTGALQDILEFIRKTRHQDLVK